MRDYSELKKEIELLFLNKNQILEDGYFESLNNGFFNKELFIKLIKLFDESNTKMMNELPKELIEIISLYVNFAIDTIAYGQVNEDFDMDGIYPLLCGLIGSTKAD